MTLLDEAFDSDDELRRAKAETTRARASEKRALGEVDRLEALLARYTVVDPSALVVPKWLATPGSDRAHHATALLLLSDLHLDEVVNLAETNGANEYNREIAKARLEAVIEGTIELCDRYVAGVEFDGIVVALLGDVITGVIHEELARTNEAPPTASIVYWVPVLAAAIKRLADHFGKVHVGCVDGNHDRTYAKIPAKQRAESSFAWVIYSWLAGVLSDDQRITFSITPAPEQVISIYDTRFLLTHGDGFRSAGGIGGIYPSMLKWLHRKHGLFNAIGQPWDVALMGHWHTYLTGPDFLVNGSLKSVDEYSMRMGFGFEPARQALAIVTPERGIVQQMPVYAD